MWCLRSFNVARPAGDGNSGTSDFRFSAHVQRVYLTAAQQVGLTPDERPKQFTIGN